MRKIIGKLTLATILISTLGACFLGLVLYNIKDVLFGTPLTVNTIADGSTVTNAFLPITGSAVHADQISINGRELGVDQQGDFTDGVILSPGYNIVEVTATDRFGREKVKTDHVVYAPSVAVAQNDVSPYQR